MTRATCESNCDALGEEGKGSGRGVSPPTCEATRGYNYPERYSASSHSLSLFCFTDTPNSCTSRPPTICIIHKRCSARVRPLEMHKG